MDLGIAGEMLQLATSVPTFSRFTFRARVRNEPEGPWHEGITTFEEPTPGNVRLDCKIAGAGVSVLVSWKQDEPGRWIDEFVTIRCDSTSNVQVDRLDIGLVMDIPGNTWSLVGIPFAILPNGRESRFTMNELQQGGFKPVDYKTDCPFWPAVCDEDELRSEAWFLGNAACGLVIIKYNPTDVEFAMIKAGDGKIRLGGAGLCLYHEPVRATSLEPGQVFEFGLTRYLVVQGERPEREASNAYYSFLESAGHGIPPGYDPRVHWNELYDIGWYHSNAAKLAERYTKDALLAEATKARDCHCETLYLDPGWEVAEGTTTWDEARLGPLDALIDEIKSMGLALAFRTILRDYTKWIPDEWEVEHDDNDISTELDWRLFLWVFKEPCIVNEPYFKEKLARVMKIVSKGMSFVMVDEHDWRGPCHATTHGHADPSTAFDHVTAVYNMCQSIKDGAPRLTGNEVLVEAHDPVWPWQHRYCPTYFRQGFGPGAAYQENWGFEFMWNPIADLRSGKALSLYYYAASCPIPLYLHISMIHDNENCLFFWWAASTVRHLGIGGKTCHDTVCHTRMVHDVEPGEQFQRYARAMEEYMTKKALFVRGRFIGIDEECHLHVLDDEPGGALVVFNFDATSQTRTWSMPVKLLGVGFDARKISVHGATGHETVVEHERLRVTVTLNAASAARVYW